MSELHITQEAGAWRLALADGAGSVRLMPRLGLDLPRYHFHVGRVVHSARELDLFRVQTTLLLGNDRTGDAELSDLQLAPGLDEAARTQVLRRLMAAVQAQIAQERSAFGDWLLIELPGWREASGASPFWQALGGRFFAGDPIATEARLGPAWRSHLAALLPRQTIYLSFLGEAAAQCLGRPADAALLQALRAEGFEPADHVRIDDGGPLLAMRLPRAA